MLFKKKNYYKPLYKQFIKLRENVQDRKKILKFRRKKWENFIKFYSKRLKRYKKFKPQDQKRYIVSKYPNKGTAYKKRFRNALNVSGKFRLYYGGVSKSYLKKQIRCLLKKRSNNKNLENWNALFLTQFETRLDTILYKSKFCISLRNSKQLIVHGKVFVNNTQVRIPSYKLKQGDLISIDPKYYYIIEQNFKKLSTLPIPPKSLTINYKTLEILMTDYKLNNISTNFPFHLNLEKILVNYYRH